jgi:hypothetical protein
VLQKTVGQKPGRFPTDNSQDLTQNWHGESTRWGRARNGHLLNHAAHTKTQFQRKIARIHQKSVEMRCSSRGFGCTRLDRRKGKALTKQSGVRLTQLGKCKPAVAYLSQEPISEGPYVIDCGGIGYCTVLEFRVVKLGTVVKCGKCEDTDKVMRFTTERWGRSVMAPGKQ